MSKTKPHSLQDILKRRQQAEFVGREEHLAFFRRNLHYEPDDDRRRFVISISGQGGVGKTWLLRRFRKIAKEAGAVSACTDEAEDDVPAVMGRIVEQFQTQGHLLKTFAERYKVYRQRWQEIGADPEVRSVFPTRLGRALAKGTLDLAHAVPGVGPIVELLDEEPIVGKVGEFAAYVARKVRSREDVHLLLQPVEVLTPLFLADLRKMAEEHPVALFFDTYERTGDILDSWLRNLLEGRHGDVPADILLTIAGRNEVDHNLWASYIGLLARLPLEPFTEEEVLDYLARKGITDDRLVEVILGLSGRLPLLVATLAAESPDDPAKVGDPSGVAVERFLRWVEDPKRRQVALDAALPRRLNRDMLVVLVGTDNDEDLFTWLRGMPFVERRADGWAYHTVVRTQMLRHKRRESPQSWAETHSKLAKYYEHLRDGLGLQEDIGREDETWQEYAVDAIYHTLCWNPRRNLPAALNAFLPILGGKGSFAHLWAEAIFQAGKDAEAWRVQEWGSQLLGGLQAYDDARYADALAFFSSLIDWSELDPQWRPIVLDWQGDLHFLAGQYEQALANLNQAIQLEPAEEEYWAHRGSVHRRMGRYDDALTDFNRAIELDSEYAWAIVRRGEVHRQFGRYDEALADFERAIELEPDNARAIANQGEAYRLMGRYREALAILNRAIELRPDYDWVFAIRGVIYSQKGRFDAAIDDFNRAIELGADLGWVLASRGETYRRMSRFNHALADFGCAIEARPDFVWAIARRGATYAMMGPEYCNDALADLNHTIELQSGLAWAFARRGEVFRRMKCYDDALADLSRSIELEPGREWRLYGRAIIRQIQGRSDDAQADLTVAIQLGRRRCEKHPRDSRNGFRLALYHLAAEETSGAIRLYQETLLSGASEYHIREAIFDLEDFLALFPDHPQARAMRDLLQKHLQEIER